MNKNIQLIMNFDSEEELSDYVEHMRKFPEYISSLTEINVKLRSVLKHCDLTDDVRNILQDLRVESIIE